MSVKSDCCIKITNLNDNCLVNHQILIIKGEVDIKQYTDAIIEITNVEPEDLIYVGLSNLSGKFKFLINLGEINRKVQLNFKYCNSELGLSIQYQKLQHSYKIQPLLILAKDESLNEENLRLSGQIIDLNLLLVQSVYAEKLNETGHKRLTFCLNSCEIFKSNLTREEIWSLNEHQLWTCLAKELLESDDWSDNNQLKFIGFINCSKYLGEEVVKSNDFSYQNIKKHIFGHAALGGGGLALFGSTYFYAWPNKFQNIVENFLDQQKLDLSKEPDDSNYRRTRSGVYSSSLGAVCHEIGHIFDLGHDLDGIMGSNFDYINRVFTLSDITENLPERLIKANNTVPFAASKPRFTSLKKTPANGFLQRFREQKENDSFYFSQNSSIILANHLWLRGETAAELQQHNVFHIEYNSNTNVLKALGFALKLIEIRSVPESLVLMWFEFPSLKANDSQVYEKDLSTVKSKLIPENYLFVMSTAGHTKKVTL